MDFAPVVAHPLHHSEGGALPPLSLLTIDVVCHQLLFQRTIPRFEPSAASYALALEFYEIGRALMMVADVHDQGDVDVFTALVAGLSHQQIANDPGGTRWVRHAGRVVEMFMADVDRRLQTKHTKGGSP
ncbi:MAG: hypothetical protein QOJ06_1054 [Pseudonocardiales bacterium]|nr:hypothetical protein [Pseudonocardiales bacterium]